MDELFGDADFSNVKDLGVASVKEIDNDAYCAEDKRDSHV